MSEHRTLVHTERSTGNATYSCSCGHQPGYFPAGAHGAPATGIAREAATLHRISRQSVAS